MNPFKLAIIAPSPYLIPNSGCTPDDVLRFLLLSAEDIAKTVVEMLALVAR
jgi:hypothetical protein